MFHRFKVTYNEDEGCYLDDHGNKYCRPYYNKMACIDGPTTLFTICDLDHLPDLREEIWLTNDDGSEPYNIVY